jgi:hypothetical protein
MKAIQSILQTLSIVTVGAAIATDRFIDHDTSYYRSSLPGANCDTQVESSLMLCDEGDKNQCSVFWGSSIQYISKSTVDMPCTSFLKK